MKNEILDKEKLSFDNLDATRVIVTTIGVLFGIGGFNHGFFEFLPGSVMNSGECIKTIEVFYGYFIPGG